MNEARRIYLMGIIVLLLAMSIPEVQQTAQRTMYSPEALYVVQTVQNSADYYVDRSTQALEHVLLYIQPVKQLVINGQHIDIDTDTNFDLTHGQSISIKQCESILQAYNSPAVHTCDYMITYATEKQIDGAYVLYIFIYESNAGTNKYWAGFKPDGTSTHNTGNIVCAGYKTCYGRFRDYSSWQDGWKDHIDLLVYYRDVYKDKTLEQVLYRWAPPVENTTAAYYQEGVKQISAWRTINKQQDIPTVTKGSIHPITKDMKILQTFDNMDIIYCYQDSRCPKGPNGEPLGNGQHFGVDVYVAPNEKVFAPVNGIFITCGTYTDSMRIGEYIIYQTDDGYEFYAGHLANTLLFCTKKPGDIIQAGEVMGYGNSNVLGPHTHIQMRKDGQLVDYLTYYRERTR